MAAVGDAKLASTIRDVVSVDDRGAMAPSDIGNMALTICYCLKGLMCFAEFISVYHNSSSNCYATVTSVASKIITF